MCGIIGYYGKDRGTGAVLAGLKSLEYRGYDSWGLAAKSPAGVNVVKRVGKIGEATEAELGLESTGVVVGHTRWATHGGVSETNAHPHLSADGKIAVVHNGIIENYRELREFLKENGVACISETDTEVIPHLIRHFLSRGITFEEAFRQALMKLEGSYAVVAFHQDYNALAFGRRGSPLVVGIGDAEYFVASDVPAFLEHTNAVIYLDEGEHGFIDKGVFIFNTATDEMVKKPVQEVRWSVEQARRGDYPHYMLKEVSEQRQTIRRAIEQPPKLLESCASMLDKAAGIFLVGCGSSYHACLTAAYQASRLARKNAVPVLASEFGLIEPLIIPGTVIVAVSQSGETADVLEAVRTAKRRGAKVLAVCNVVGSTLTRIADETIIMNSGPEICVLSTKTYTAQVALLTLLAYALAGRTEEGRKAITEAAENVDRLIGDNNGRLKALAEKLKGRRDLFIIGRDLAYGSALEGALKIKEVSYIHAEGFAGGELKHGTIALIEPGVPAIVLSTPETRAAIHSNAMEVKARGGFIIGLDSARNEAYDVHIDIPDAGAATPLLLIIPLQLLAYHLAVARGCDPDKPRNLAKSVTVK
jgi:glucosamine--fructose-6-phosphate aminotransferase (isomerizing)